MISGRQFQAALLGILIPLAAVVGSGQAHAEEHVIRVVSDYENLRMYFSPKLLQIKSGDTVTWVNEAKEHHNMLSCPDGYPEGAQGFLSEDLTEQGQTWSHVFTVPGTYEYHCLPHLPMGMRGGIVVDRPSEDSEFHQPTKQEVADYRNRLLEYFDEDEYQYTSRAERESTAVQ